MTARQLLFAAAAVSLASLVAAASPAARRVDEDAAGRWPMFRGPQHAGVAARQQLPEKWELRTGQHVRWKVEIPGLSHSSPIVWGPRVYVTTAISSRSDASFRKGLYGDGDASEDRSVHRWVVVALDAATGRVVWERTAFEGVPREKRHIKATYANATPTTDGRTVVAFFGSQGLYALDAETGRLRWSQDLGALNAGAYNDPSYEWGTASSPVIHAGRVIVQADQQAGSFLQAFDLASGRSLWKVSRDELPSWSTPAVLPGRDGHELVTNAPNYIRGYDPATGEERWRLGGSSKITAPTPIAAGGLFIVASGRAPERPIFAIRPGARGDITLRADETTSAAIAWSRTQRGPYMPTPLAYEGRLYILSNQGLFDCYDLATGAEIYRQRIPHQGSGFSASPVAADGRIYLSSEDGDVFVIRAGPAYELLATNAMEGSLMATPAIANQTLYFRTDRHVVAVAR
jgi:outer membrane protein assembly factor BamB